MERNFSQQNLVLELLSECNLECIYCMRQDTNLTNFKLSYEDVLTALESFKRFETERGEIEIKLSGGEPTIWQDGDKNITDIFIACRKFGIPFAMVSNGIIFEEYENIESIFKRYFDQGFKKIKVYFTIDKWHSNYNRAKGESLILDNMKRYMEENDMGDAFDITVQTTFTNRKEDNLTIDFIKKYNEMGYKFMINPLLPWGRGRKMQELIPTLKLNSTEKDTLGHYKYYFYLLGFSEKKWADADEYEEMRNLDILLLFNYCGRSIFVRQGNVYYCGAHVGKENFKVSTIEDFSYKRYKEHIRNNEVVNMIYSDRLKERYEASDELLKSEFSFDYGICALCKEIAK